MRLLASLIALSFCSLQSAWAVSPDNTTTAQGVPPNTVPTPQAAPPVAPQRAQPNRTAAAPAIPSNESIKAALDAITVPDWTGEPAVISTNIADVSPLQPLDVLREYRIASVVAKKFVRPQRTISVFVYTYPDARAAFGAYSSLRIGSSNIVVRGDLSSEDDQNICFLKGSRFVCINSSVAEDDMSKQAASKVADQLAAAIDEHAEQRSFFNALPTLDRMSGTEHIFMGPIAARKFISVPFVELLRLNDARTAVGATYQFPHPEPDRAKVMIVDYGDQKLASTIYSEYAGKLASLYKSRLITQTVQVSRTRDTFLLFGCVGTRIFISNGARRKITPLVLARSLM